MTLAVAMALVLSGPAPVTPPCSIVRTGEVYVREPTETWVVGSILADTIADGVRDSLAAGHNFANRGHAVVVESVTGNGSARIQVGDTVAVFLWSLGPSCERSAYPSLPVGSRQHFELSLRPDSTSAGGMATLDLDPTAGLGVHPGRSASGISVDEYARFVSLIPTRAEWDADCRPGVQRTNAWISAHIQGPPPGTRPFGHVAVGLVGACETNIIAKGNALLRGGAPSAPPEVLRWADAEGCGIRAGWPDTNLQVVSGRFLPEPEGEQWAMICASESRWRLVIMRPAERRILAKLASAVGSPRQHDLRVAPPEFFRWASLYDPDDVGAVLAPPEFDAVLLDDYAYFWQRNAFSAARFDCCYFEY